MTLRALSVRFAGMFVLATTLVAVAAGAAEVYLGLEGNVGMAVIPAMVAALHCGDVQGRRTGAMPGARRAWRASVIFTAVNVAISAILFGALVALDPNTFTAMPRGAFAGVAAAMFPVCVAPIRWLFGPGARTGLTAAARKAARPERA